MVCDLGPRLGSPIGCCARAGPSGLMVSHSIGKPNVISLLKGIGLGNIGRCRIGGMAPHVHPNPIPFNKQILDRFLIERGRVRGTYDAVVEKESHGTLSMVICRSACRVFHTVHLRHAIHVAPCPAAVPPPPSLRPLRL